MGNNKLQLCDWGSTKTCMFYYEKTRSRIFSADCYGNLRMSVYS